MANRKISDCPALTDKTATGKKLLVETSDGLRLLSADEALEWLQTISSSSGTSSILNEAKEYTNQQIGRLSRFEAIPVNVLPTENIRQDAIYLVPNGESGSNNTRTEYIYVNNTWEIVGSTEITQIELVDSVTSTATNKAATANAVKTAYDKAEAAFQSASNGKTLVAQAITGKGVNTSATATFEQMATNIGQIQGGSSMASPNYVSFYRCDKTTINLSWLNTSNITDMSYMFAACSNLRILDLSNFNTSKVKYMMYMFNGSAYLPTLDFSSFDTSKVLNMSSMFELAYYSGTEDRTLDLSSFNTSSNTDMQRMFRRCRCLISIDVSSFDTSKVTSMSSCFEDCANISALDLSNFNTSQVTEMNNMFKGCQNLATLNISNFDFTNVTSYYSMFNGIPDDCLIIVHDNTAKTWITDKFTNLTNVKTLAEMGA